MLFYLHTYYIIKIYKKLNKIKSDYIYSFILMFQKDIMIYDIKSEIILIIIKYFYYKAMWGFDNPILHKLEHNNT
jgi:hypothetical protein